LFQEVVHFAAVNIGVSLVPERTQILVADGLEMERMDRFALSIEKSCVQRHSVDVIGETFGDSVSAQPAKIVVEGAVLLHKEDDVP